jgi:hypothetical protein
MACLITAFIFFIFSILKHLRLLQKQPAAAAAAQLRRQLPSSTNVKIFV